MTRRVLVITSTMPASDADHIPAFVKDQVRAMKDVDSSLEFRVLAPHDKRSNTTSYTKHTAYEEYRFHYFWPFRFERLAGVGGILSALKANPLNYALIPFLFVGEFVSVVWHTARFKPDVIYAHWFTPQAVVARCAALFVRRAPFVFTTHASDVDVWHKIPLVGTYIVRWATRKADAFTAVSERSMHKLEVFFSPSEWSALRQRSRIIPMGVELPEKLPTVNSKGTRIVFIGRLVEKKGIQYLLPAFATLAKNNPDLQLHIGGDGLMADSLKQQVSDLGIGSSVTFHGYVTGKEKEQLIQSANIYIVPSIITDDGDVEGLPVSLLEGLAHSKVCIATNESGADGILTHGKDGLLVPQKDSDALTQALEEAFALSTKQREAMTKAAHATAQLYSWPVIARQHIDFLLKEAVHG